MHLNIRVFKHVEDFKNHVENLNLSWRPSFIVVHNTSVPTQELYKSWHSKSNWTQEQWLKNLASYYAGLGWNGCPHLFVAYDAICILNDLKFSGVHSPSWNKISWGVETVAEFNYELFDNGVQTNLIAALGVLHSKLGISPDTLKFHKEDVRTTHKECPGKNLNKQSLIMNVKNYMKQDEGLGEVHGIPEHVQTAETDNLSLEELTSIKWVQQYLNKCGFSLTVDGIVGSQTIAAVKKFQEQNSLKIDGVAGPITRLVLKGVNNAN